MIARVWTARAARENAAQYVDHFQAAVLPVLRGLDGFVGATVLQRHAAQATSITVITRWQSIDAVRRFAGSDIEAAVVGDEAAAMLMDWDRRVHHHEIAFDTVT